MEKDGANWVEEVDENITNEQPASNGGHVCGASTTLSGRFNVSIDDKGRFVVPAKCRESLGNEVYLLALKNGNIQVWPKEAAENGPWAEIEAKYREHKRACEEKRSDAATIGYTYTVRSVLLGLYFSVTLDRQGRLLLPPDLRSLPVGHEGPQLLTGCGDHMLLRTEEAWNVAVKANELAIAQFLEEYD